MVVGSARPLEDAWRASQVGMVGWLGELYGLDPLDAYQLLTQISLSPIANVVDVNYSAVTKVPKRWLPTAQAYGGMHRHLRAQAATLGVSRRDWLAGPLTRGDRVQTVRLAGQRPTSRS